MDGSQDSQIAPLVGDKVRILVAAHSHIALTKGGAEVAAYELFKHLKSHSAFTASFLACSRDAGISRDGSTITQPFGVADEYLYHAANFDWFHFANRDRAFPEVLATLLRQLQPHIVHLHHYIVFGVEVILHIRKILPDCVIIVTLHEYLAICNNQGQMIKRQSTALLCQQSSPLDCAKCFPENSMGDFFLRKKYIMRFFNLVDQFISPSHFLAERYVAWGLPNNKISMIENLGAVSKQMAVSTPSITKRHWMTKFLSSPSSRHVGNPSLRIGFFGQISQLKGIDLLFDAADLLNKSMDGTAFVFDIHGSIGQNNPYEEIFHKRLAAAPPSVRYHGPYDNHKVDLLMQQIDVVLMPSIWWENSPVVIQEAQRNGKAVVCSDIGGMAEKVIDGETGFHFSVGSSISLVTLLKRLANDTTILNQVNRNLLRRQRNKTDALAQHIELYRSLLRLRNPVTSLKISS